MAESLKTILVKDNVKYEVEHVSASLVLNPVTNQLEQVETPFLSKQQAEKAFPVASAIPYDYDEDDEEDARHPEYANMTTFEVMVRKQAQRAAKGQKDAVNLVTGYILGKPKQQVETKNISVNYLDLLDRIESEAEEIKDINISNIFG